MTQSYLLRGKQRAQRALLLVPFLLAAACGDDQPEAGYYLRGRVFDGASMDPIAKAELTLLSGQETINAVSDEDGMYKIGPIQPSASYRLDAKARGKADFEFTGLALPALAVGVNDLTVIGDVALFDANKKAPAFMLKLASNDARAPVEIASVDFAPFDTGADPKQGLGLLNPTTTTTTTSTGTTTTTTPVPTTVAAAPAPTVIGAFAQPSGSVLPNHVGDQPQTFHVNVLNGQVMIPEGALSFGATYDVKVAAGPDFSDVHFMLTAARDNEIMVVMTTKRSFPSSLSDTSQRYFTGRIYNGVSLERVKSYEMTVEYFDRVLTAEVDSEGRFIVGPVLPNADYTVAIKADGFRSFLSHNAKFGATGAGLSSWYYDAFLYPSNVEAPAVQARFTLDDSTTLPSGTVRFAPAGSSSLVDQPAGVAGQVWLNSEDLQQRAVVKSFTDGKVEIAQGELVLGVRYDVTVFGTGSYQIDGGTYTAGESGNPLFTLSHVAETALAVVAMSSEAAALSANGSVEIRFNQDILAWPQMDETSALLAVNRGISIDSPDKDGDTERNTLAAENADPNTTPADFRGVSWEISGNRLTLSWDREKGLSTSDTGDPINSLVYQNLNAIQLYTGVKATSPQVGLGTLVQSATGDSDIDVQMIAN